MSSDNADFDCPGGGTFYACTSGSMFLGCCKSNPCGNSGCRDNDLTPASFNASYSGSFPDQFCSAGSFYVCKLTDPPFLGCCEDNPCQEKGCANSYLVAATLLDANAALSFPTSTASSSASQLSSSTSSTSSNSRTSSSVIATTSTSTSAITSATSSSNIPNKQGLSRGAIAGIGVGAFIVLLAIVAVVVALCTRRDRRTTQSEKQSFVLARRTEPVNNFYVEPQARTELEAPATRLNERAYVPQGPPSSTPFNPSVISSPSTTIDSYSPAISSLAPSPDTTAGQWNDLHSRVAELAGSEASTQSRRSELNGSAVINVGYQSRSSLLSSTSNPYNNPSTYGGNGMRYQAYRPPP